MNRDEIEALASRIAELLGDREWIPGPVRPEPHPGPSPGKLPPWAGAAQNLSDVAPGKGRGPAPARHRPAYDTLTTAARAAAAGRGPSPLPGGDTGAAPAPRGNREVPVAMSNRHIHLTAAAVQQLFGAGSTLTSDRPIRQPGQFAAKERLRVVGPTGAIDGVRVVGPARGVNQVELALSDCRKLGLDAPIRASGTVAESAPIRLEGPAGSLDLPEGAMVAARHLHVGPDDEDRLGVRDGDRVTLLVGSGERTATLPDVLVRSGTTHATELHVDADEARAFLIEAGSRARLIGRPRRGSGQPGVTTGKTLITERDVSGIAASGRTLSDAGGLIITPAARDRAKALGIWRGKA